MSSSALTPKTGDVAHRVEARGLEPGGDAVPDAPEVRQGAVRPVFAAIAGFVQLGDAHPVLVGRDVLGLDVHRDLAEVEVGPDAGRGRDARLAEHLLDDLAREVVGREPVGAQVGRGVDEHLVDRIDVDVFRREIAQVDPVNLAADLHVVRHPGRGHDVLQLQRRVREERGVVRRPAAETPPRRAPAPLGVDPPDRLHHLEEAGAAGDPVRLERRRDRQADGLLRAARVRHHQMRVQGVKTPVHALHGGVERLQVDGDVCTGFHKAKLAKLLEI